MNEVVKDPRGAHVNRLRLTSRSEHKGEQAVPTYMVRRSSRATCGL